MKKDEIEVYSELHSPELPSINVRVRRFARELTAERLGCDESTFSTAMEYAWEMARERFWEDVQEQAKHYLGAGVEVYSAGRSGGHLIVSGLPPVESWDAIRVSAWGRFVAAVEDDIRWLSSADSAESDIIANRWNEVGAEQYNFTEKEDGESVCISEMKQLAIAAGFGPVVRG